jgi:PAS domain S-box-containing protein
MTSAIRLLYVDDEPSLLDIGKLFLEESGDFSVITRESATAALDLLGVETFDVIVSDYQMPGMDGIRFLVEVRSRFGQIPFILFTGRGREEIVIQAINSGADFYLQKGGDPAAQFAELSHKVRSAVAQRLNEQAFKESEERFRGITERISDLILIVDADGLLNFISPSATRILGFPPEAFAGKKAGTEFIPADDAIKIGTALERLKNGSPEERLEFRMKKHDGSYAVFDGKGMPVFKNGIYSGAQVIAREITERKHAEDALRIQHKLSLQLNHCTRLDNAFRLILSAALEMNGLDAGGIYVMDPLTEKLNLMVHQGLSPDFVERVSHYNADSPNVIRAKAGLPIYGRYADIQLAGADPVLLREGITAIATIPVLHEGELVALMNVASHTAEEIHPSTKNFLETFAMQIGSTLERIRSRTRLQESELRFRSLIQNASDIIRIINADGRIVYDSPSSQRILGYPEGHTLGKSPIEYIHPDDRERVQADLSQVFTRANPGIPTEFRIRKADGNYILVESVATNLLGVQGIDGIVTTTRPIEERRHVEEALRESEERLSLVLEGAELGTWDWNVATGTVIFNKRWAEMLGYSLDAVKPCITSWERLVHPEDLPKVRQLLDEHLDGRSTVYEAEHRLRTRGGDWLWVVARGKVIRRDEAGKPLRAVGIHQNIMAMKQNEEVRTRFGRILESSLQEIYFFDPHTFRFVDVNYGARENLGYSMEELLSMTPLDIKPEFTRDALEELVAPLRSGEKERQVFFTVHRRKDGSLYPVEVHLQLAKNELSPVFVAIVLDITERKQTEEALRQANWKLNLLSGITRHDINNQMTALRGYLSILKTKKIDPSLSEYIVKMDATAQRISSMIQFTKEYDEIGVTLPVWLDVSLLVTKAGKEAPLGTVTLTNEIPAGMELFAEPLIFKVFYNLMDNAVQYGETLTHIRFYTESRPGELVIICEDNGVGIASEDKENIFLRGFGKNTGLGLALSREILDITGIGISETGTPGQGARFEIAVPNGLWRMRMVENER